MQTCQTCQGSHGVTGASFGWSGSKQEEHEAAWHGGDPEGGGGYSWRCAQGSLRHGGGEEIHQFELG